MVDGREDRSVAAASREGYRGSMFEPNATYTLDPLDALDALEAEEEGVFVDDAY